MLAIRGTELMSLVFWPVGKKADVQAKITTSQKTSGSHQTCAVQIRPRTARTLRTHGRNGHGNAVFLRKTPIIKVQ